MQTTSQLVELYTKSPAASFIVTDLERTLGLTHGEIIAAMQKLDQDGKGRFIVGRRGYPSRFVWHNTKMSVVPVSSVPSADFMTEITLAGGRKIRFSVPADLSADEAVRAASMITAAIVPQPQEKPGSGTYRKVG